MKMKFTVIVMAAFLLSVTQAFSQTPAQQWDADFGGSDNEQFAISRQTKDGGYILGGIFFR